MDENKLTDEEIIKALDICYNEPCCSNECPYFNKHGRNFCVEDKALYKDMKRVVQEHAEQKAEIERLTEENRVVIHNMDFHRNKKFELQKQVDELTAFKNEAISLSLYGKGRKDGEEVAVKDTAKEILTEIDDLTLCIIGGSNEFEKGYFQAIADMKTAIKDLLKEKYTVEVK